MTHVVLGGHRGWRHDGPPPPMKYTIIYFVIVAVILALILTWGFSNAAEPSWWFLAETMGGDRQGAVDTYGPYPSQQMCEKAEKVMDPLQFDMDSLPTGTTNAIVGGVPQKLTTFQGPPCFPCHYVVQKCSKEPNRMN